MSSPDLTAPGASAAITSARRRRRLGFFAARAGALRPGVLIRAMRPRQWSKNVLVAAAPCAAGAITQPEIALHVAMAFTAFCLLASSTYLINDVRDVEQDRLHPRKRLRPIAAGELAPHAALLAGCLMAFAGVALAWVTAPTLAAVAVGYLAITVTYSVWWRRIVAIDILAIASGFVLRAIAGGAADDIHLSRSFLMVAGFGAVFLVAGKRYAELREGATPTRTRATLRNYSSRALRIVLISSALSAVGAYGIWAFAGPGHGLWHLLSILPLSLGLARYGFLLDRGAGQSPEETIAQDRPLLVLGAVWSALFLAGVYAGQ